MPSFQSVFLRLQLRFIKPFLKKASIEVSRKTQAKIGALCAKAQQTKVAFEQVDFPQFSACWVTPENVVPRPSVVLYLHGGSYVSGNLEYARGFGSILSVQTGRRLFCPAYRLAPEHPFPAALEDAVTCYRYLLAKGFAPKNIAVVGESAGGGLAFCLCVQLKTLDLPQPGCIVALSPWADLTLSGASYRYNRYKDPTLSREALRNSAHLYAYDGTDKPTVSPVFADFSLLPPSLIFAGGWELLLDDALTLHRRLKNAGCQCELHVEPGMWHVYTLFWTPESARSLQRIEEFLKEIDNLS